MGDVRLILTDGSGRQLDDQIDAWGATRRRTLDGRVWTDDLDLEATSQGVDKGRYVVAHVDGEWREWRVSSPDEIREDTRPRCDVACVDGMRELTVTRHIEHFHETAVTPRRALEFVLQETRWTVGEVPDMDPVDLELDAVDGWTALTTIADTFGLEVWSTMIPDSGMTRIVDRQVHMAVRRGGVSGRRFDYSDNLTRIRRTFDATEVATRIIPLGKQVEKEDGSKRRVTIAQANQGVAWLDVDDAELASRWGVADATGAVMPACRIVVHDDIDDPGLLRNAGLEDLETASRPSVAYEATIAGWQTAGLDPVGLHAGDTVQIVDSTFSPALRLEGRVTGIEADLLAGPDEATISIGDITQGISSTRTIAVDTAATVAAGKPVWDASATQAATAVSTANTANGIASGAATGADSALQAAANAVSTALDAKEMASGMEGRLAAVETTVASLPDEYQPKGEYLVAEDISGLLSADDIQPGDGITVSKSDDGKLTVSARGPFPPVKLDNGADLDTVREYGFYRKQWGDVVANAPSGDAESSFLLTVIPMTDDGEDSDVLQRVEPAGGVGAVTEPFYRNYSGSGGWTPWRKYASETGADANDK